MPRKPRHPTFGQSAAVGFCTLVLACSSPVLGDETVLAESPGETVVGFAASTTQSTQPIVTGPVASDPALDLSDPQTTVTVEQGPVVIPPLLDGRQIGCRAAMHSLPAASLRQRARTLVQLFENEKRDQRQAASDLACFLRLQAEHQQDLAAAAAMRAYYTRIAICEQLALANESIEFLSEEEKNLTAARLQGLPIDVDSTGFFRRRIEIEDQQARLFSQDRNLRLLLEQFAKTDYEQAEICQERLQVRISHVDYPALSQQALAERRDLQGWQFLRHRATKKTATVYAKMLATLTGGWGLPMPQKSGLHRFFHRPDREQFSVNLKRELTLTVEMQQELICQAVAERCEALQLAYQRMQFARKTIASWRERIQQLEQMAGQGDPQPDARANARSELLKERAEEIRRRLEARLAEIDLAETVGGLHDRCCQASPWLPTGRGGI